jgi:hypothetical protein
MADGVVRADAAGIVFVVNALRGGGKQDGKFGD